jgi:hypothetical protein
VTVTVLDSNGKPVNGAYVVVMDERERTVGVSPMPVTVQGGMLHGPGIKPGKYLAGAVIGGKFVGPVPFEVTEGARTEVRVQ